MEDLNSFFGKLQTKDTPTVIRRPQTFPTAATPTVIKTLRSQCDKTGSTSRRFLTHRAILTTADIDQVSSDIQPNIIRGSYENVEHYLDIHFRLLREDVLRPIREAVAWCRRHPSVGGCTFRVYHEIKGFERCYDVFGKTFKLAVPTATNIKWTTTKRLGTGSLVCLSPDDFQTLILAVIDQRFSPEPGTCIIRVKIESGDSCNKDLDFSKTYTLVDTEVFYEAYGHVLRVLQEYNSINFPFPQYIVSLSKLSRRPKYEDRSGTFLIPEEIREDVHQEDAFRHALSSELAIIQGPPGTGKTFLSLKLVEILLRHNMPVLVVCYTNHALDQFLEGTLAFTSKLVRIGSRCESTQLQPYILRNIRKAITEWKKVRRGVASELNGSSDRAEILKQSLKVAQSLIGKVPPKCSVGSVLCEMKEIFQKLRSRAKELDILEFQPLESARLQTVFSAHNSKSPVDINKSRTIHSFLSLESRKLNIYETLEEFNMRLTEAKRCFLHPKINIGQEQSFSDPDSADDMSRSSSLESLNLFDAICGNKEFSFQQDANHFPAKFKKLNTPSVNDSKLSKSDEGKDNIKAILQNRSVETIFAEKLFEMKDQMTIKEVQAVHDIWQLSLVDRWRFCRYWRCHLIEVLKRKLSEVEEFFNEMVERFHEELCDYNYEIIQHADIIGVTTTGASKNRSLIELLKPRIVLVEEAAEVLEAHTITSIVPETEHLILVGDHQQLRPIPSNYDLAQNYNLDISLFERLVSNGIPYRRLEVQHRMRPCIAQLLVPTIYPTLRNHSSVYQYPDIRGMKDNMYFFSHNQPERSCAGKSHSNPYEARFVLSLCTYLLKQGYGSADITVLTTYSGQRAHLSNLFKSSNLTGVRITTVDNFQGEENDIILLSFVRSNSRGNLGFVKVSNRMCVALSRARKGLYCFGNFEMFSENSPLWSNIVTELKARKQLGRSFLLKCVRHSTISSVSSFTDFEICSPNGGCHQKCLYSYPCGHKCLQTCHGYMHTECDMSIKIECNTCKLVQKLSTLNLSG